jgi:hypothetical protein
MSDAQPPVAPDAAEPSPGGDAAGADPRQRWIIVLSAAAAVAVMAGVIVLAKARAGGHTPERAGAPYDLPGAIHLPERHPVGPAGLESFPQGCAPDYDNPGRIRLEAPANGIDFGKIRQGVKAERDLVIRNVGTGRLCLAPIVAGCGCVKAHLVEDQRRLEPGEETVVKLIFDSHGLEGVTTKTITVRSTDTATPVSQVSVRAEVALGLIVAGRRVEFGKAGKDLPAKAALRLRSPKDDPPWTVEAVESVPVQGVPETPPPLTFETREVEDPTWRVVEVTIRHPGRSAYGPSGGQVKVRTSHPDRPEITLPYWLEVVASVVPVPSSVSLGFVPRAGHARVRLLPQHAGVAFRVTGVKVETPDGGDPGPAGPGFTVEHGPADKPPHLPGEWWVDVRYDGRSRQPGLLRAVAVIATDAPDAQEIRVPITATVPKTP